MGPSKPSKGMYVFMEIDFVCVSFVVSLSFTHAWVSEPWLPLGPTTCNI